MSSNPDIWNVMARLREGGVPFALVSVVRTVSVTAAKAGAHAIILEDGAIHWGWIGGGCARGATIKAARECIADGQSRLISVQPGDRLAGIGVKAGDTREGVRYARNMCPSEGTMDLFIEPILPPPELVVMGASPVALVLVELAGRFGFDVTAAAPESAHPLLDAAARRIVGFELPKTRRQRFIVVSTQGAGDEAALTAALAHPFAQVLFVGSRRKAAALASELREQGIEPARLDAVKAPAGLDIGAVTPDEIALSILAELVQIRARPARSAVGLVA
ncbi:XdhC family protein [Rhodoblastus sp.]|uniref:XdhC family protein n=1 Tax=Rhodoblastus sp. TaxID=1962975 RepID=UPI0035B061E2